MKIKKLSIAFFVSIMIVGCSASKNSFEVKISGSATMKNALNSLAAEYMNENHNSAIVIESEGSNVGIEKLINGEADICAASRNLNSNEIYELVKKKKAIGMFYLVARDAILLIKSPNLKIDNLTIEQTREIFSGKVSRWESLGDDTGKIFVALRNPNSGTRYYFKNFILENEDFTENGKIFLSNEEINEFVKKNQNAIGFTTFNSIKNEKEIILKLNGVFPSEENIMNEKYFLVRRLYLIVSKEPEGEIKKFINWVLGPKGQKIIKEAGYIPAWKYPD